MKTIHWTAIGTLTCALLLPNQGHTQAGDATPALEEIIVTAQKREQSFNDVGLAVSVFSSDEIRELRFFKPEDVAAQTPNVKINETLANSIPNVVIRGVGLNDYAVNNNPAAGIYVDEVYLVSPAMLTFQLFDLERIEVLKGPQGTLYGRNTTAGAVNFISRKPTEDFNATATLDVGNYDFVGAEGAIGGQIVPGLNGRFAAQTYQRGEGHQTNRLTGEDVGEIDRTSWRGLLQWQPNDEITVLFNAHGGEDQSDVWLTKVDNPFTPADDDITDPFTSAASNESEMDLDALGGALTIDWALSDALTLTSVTGFEKLQRLHIEDRDASSLIQLDGVFLNEVEQFSQELRATYASGDWVLIGGAFYGNDDVETRDRFDASDLLPLLGLAGVDAIGNEYRQETDSQALFVHSEWQWQEDWKLTAGLRYTNEEKEFSDAFTYLLAGGAEIQVFPPVSNDYDVDDLSGKLGVDYSGFENTLVYASISKGFKSGGFQGQLTFNPADLTAFEEETMYAYEIGTKSLLLDGTMQFNTAVFFYDYEDLQFYGGLFDSPVGTLFGITNVGDAEVTGAEAELWWRPAVGLDVRLGLGLLDTEITRSQVAGVAEGSELPNSPELSFNALVRYEWNLTPDLVADVMLAAVYQDEVTFDIIRAPAEAIEDSYWLADARIGISNADRTWNAFLWAENLFDETYRTQVLFSSVGFGSNYGMPRTYGVGATFNWQ
ncbi:TonB-dependent receptor [Lentisalinibacter sediminis]|uniref:TonB-dependent receptor n=1 Tax=Lentisalinibacter sediminis TaxID=2992237 RepID=UPI00386E1AAC